MKKTIVPGLFVVTLMSLVACKALADFGNNRTEIMGEWQKIEMSFPGQEVYEFSGGLIRVDGVERGSYTFRGHTKIEVTFDELRSYYKVDFPDDKTMIWFKTGDDGEKERVAEFRRAIKDEY